MPTAGIYFSLEVARIGANKFGSLWAQAPSIYKTEENAGPFLQRVRDGM
jgi:hypothetical protein